MATLRVNFLVLLEECNSFGLQKLYRSLGFGLLLVSVCCWLSWVFISLVLLGECNSFGLQIDATLGYKLADLEGCVFG
ncbi:unnamed protein product [Camellia sinensis]